MAVRRISRSFKDISLSFDAHPVTKVLTVIKNANAIKRSIRNLVQTIPSERFFNPLVGSNVRSQLFEFVDFGTAAVIQKEILTTIENFEPRVDNVTVEAIARPDDGEFEVTVFFDIVGQDFPTQDFTFMLEATR